MTWLDDFLHDRVKVVVLEDGVLFDKRRNG